MAGRMGPVTLEVCFSCSAVWFTREDLAHVVQAGPAVLWRLCERVRATGGRGGMRVAPILRCPCCYVPLVSAEYASMPGVRLLGCGKCQGFWLDADALSRIAVKLAEMVPPSPPNPAPPPPQVAPTPPQVAPPSVAGPPASAPQPQPGVPTRPTERRETTPWGPGPIPPGTSRSGEVKSHPCPGCGESNPEKAPVCWACGKLLQGVVVGQCPRCTGNRRRMNSAGVELSCCEDCGGVWLEDGRLGALLIQPSEQQDALLAELWKSRSGRLKKVNAGLLCPHCDLVMFTAPVGMMSPRPVDTCPQCRGIFMDHGVLDEILLGQRR